MEIKEFVEFHKLKIQQFWNIMLRFFIRQRIKLRLKKDAEQKIREENTAKQNEIMNKTDDSKKALENLKKKYSLLTSLTGINTDLHSTSTDSKTFDCKHNASSIRSEFKLIASGEKIEYIPVTISDKIPEIFHKKLFFNKKYLCNLGNEYLVHTRK